VSVRCSKAWQDQPLHSSSEAEQAYCMAQGGRSLGGGRTDASEVTAIVCAEESRGRTEQNEPFFPLISDSGG
jgi:hypothetical protein